MESTNGIHKWKTQLETQTSMNLWMINMGCSSSRDQEGILYIRRTTTLVNCQVDSWVHIKPEPISTPRNKHPGQNQSRGVITMYRKTVKRSDKGASQNSGFSFGGYSAGNPPCLGTPILRNTHKGQWPTGGMAKHHPGLMLDHLCGRNSKHWS